MKFGIVALFLLLTGLIVGCGPAEPLVVVVTATPGASATENTENLNSSPVPAGVEIAEIDPIIEQQSLQVEVAAEYIVQAGDTLTAIAAANNTTLEALMDLNQISDPNVISVGQIIQLPPAPDQVTPDTQLLADTRLIRGPGSNEFDVAAFVAGQPGYIGTATDTVPTNQANGLPVQEILTASEVVSRVSLEFSVDPRILLAMLEYRAGWLSNPSLPVELQISPLISEENSGTVDRKGLYRQLAWTANELNRGYYGWKYDSWRILEFDEGERLLFADNLNPATVGLQHLLHLNRNYGQWQYDISSTGLVEIYRSYFGDPLDNNIDPLTGMGSQPDFTLPFASGETWFFTGGAHGGWGGGSAWAAIDFAPPDERIENILCYTSASFARAVAPGIIVRSHQGVVVLDLDDDGNETTGWTILYLHIASQDRVAAGSRVDTGDIIGRPACEGGFSTATHMHIARRYNGEWLPADCQACSPDLTIPPFTLSGWSVVSFKNQEYQGYLQQGEERRTAEQGRLDPVNRVSW